MANRFLPHSIRLNLFLVVLACGLPLLVLILASGWERREEQIHDARLTVFKLAETIARQQEGATLGIHGMLSALSLFPEVQTLDAASCTQLFQHLNELTPFYVNFALFNLQGDAVASALPFRQVNIADRKEFADAVRTRSFSVGAYAVGRVSKSPILPFSHPVLDPQGQLVGVVLISFDIQKVATLFQLTSLPPDSFIGFADHKGTRLFHYPPKDVQPIGERINQEVWDTIQPIENNGLFTESGNDGIRRIFAVRRLRLESGQTPYLNVFVGIPESEILAKADQATKQHLLWLAASLLASSCLAWLVGKYGIFQRVNRIVSVTQRLGSGDWSARSGLTESRGILGKLATSIDEMAAALARDTAELRRVKDALEAEMLRRNNLMDSSTDGIVVINQEFRVVEANRRFAEMLGYAPEEVVTLRIWDFEASLSEADVRREFADLSKVHKVFESAHRRKDGKTICVEVSASGTRVFEESLVFTIIRDITERKQMENALQHEQEFTNALLASLPGIFYLYSYPELRLVRWNSNHEKLLGFAPGEIAGRSVMDWHPPEHRELVRQAIQGAMDQELNAIESPLLTKTGNQIPFLLTGVRFSALGKTYLMGVGMDITERKRIESELIEMRDKAETANRAKSEFLATMSHEIRTPLNGVLGMLQLARSTSLTLEQAGYVDTAMQSGRSLLRVLSDVLDISRIEAGALAIIVEDFSPAEVFEPVVQAFRDQAAASGVDFSSVLDPGFPGVLRGDAGRIRQVAYNLVGNALKYTESGEVRLEACILPGIGTPEKVRLLLAVSDTGIGVPAEKVQDIFGPFTQVDGSHTRRYGGIGLGLAIVKRLVGLMGGEMSFCSRIGAGTDVHVLLPLELGRSERPAGPPLFAVPDSPAETRRLDVLLAEDDLVNRLTVSHMLDKAGHRVQAVGNGVEALAYLAEHRVDCVLMDIQMPELDGLKATRLIRAGQTGATPGDVPIIAITAYAMKGDRDQFLSAGMDGYVSKPVDMAELERVLAKVVPRNNRKN